MSARKAPPFGFNWTANGWPSRTERIIREHETARARIRNDGHLGCIARALTPEQAVTRAAAALGETVDGHYQPWADPDHVRIALEQSLSSERVA